MAKFPSIKLNGDRFAKDMGIIFAENLADLLAKVDDGRGKYEKGFIHTSTVPHEGTCYYDQIWARDAGRGLQELARFGFVDDAKSVAEYILSHKNFGDHWGRIIDRPINEDFELDGNTHILNGIVQTWRASGKDISLGRYYCENCRDVFEWMKGLMKTFKAGSLIPCFSELAGNPISSTAVYAIYPNYGAFTAMKSFAEMSAFCGLCGYSEELNALSDRLFDGIMSHLVSNGNPNFTSVPKGIWLNGLTDNGSTYETAEFDATFAIHHWTRQLPFIQNYDNGISVLEDDKAKAIHTASYHYIRHQMAKGEYFRKYGFVSNTCWGGAGGRHDDTMCGYGQNYFTQAALMMDDVNTYGKCLEGIARLAYDGNVIENMSFEMNPYIMHECFDYDNYEAALDHTFGTHAVDNMRIAENPGDEGNLVQASETLKTISLVLGVDVKDNELIIAPRLPWRWDSLEVNDLPAVGDDGTIHTVSFRYLHERHLRRCSLTVADSGGIERVRVRFGPFPKVVSTRNDISRFVREEHDGATFFWCTGSNEQAIQL